MEFKVVLDLFLFFKETTGACPANVEFTRHSSQVIAVKESNPAQTG